MSATDSFFPVAAPCTAAEAEGAVSSLPAPNAEEEILMLRVQAGDESALGLLFDRYAGTVLGIGLRILRDPGEAQELVQDVFLHLYEKRHQFDPSRGTARAWLLQITYHRALDRREYLQVRRFYDSRNVDDFSDVMPASSNIEYEAQLSECEAVLRRAFETLNTKQRLTLTLFFFEGYTLREISQRLDDSLPNIRHCYYRGLKRLKDSVDMKLFSMGG